MNNNKNNKENIDWRPLSMLI